MNAEAVFVALQQMHIGNHRYRRVVQFNLPPALPDGRSRLLVCGFYNRMSLSWEIEAVRVDRDAMNEEEFRVAVLWMQGPERVSTYWQAARVLEDQFDLSCPTQKSWDAYNPEHTPEDPPEDYQE